MSAEQRANTLKSEKEAEMKHRSAMNTISNQIRRSRSKSWGRWLSR